MEHTDTGRTGGADGATNDTDDGESREGECVWGFCEGVEWETWEETAEL